MFALVLAAALALPAGPEYYVHRGECGGYTENGVKAFACTGQEYEDHGMEVDLEFSRGGASVVMHDPTVDRTSRCSGEVAKREWGSYLSKCKLDDGSPLPHLKSAVDHARRYNMWLLIDAKVMPPAASWGSISWSVGDWKSKTIVYSSGIDRYHITPAFKARGYKTAAYNYSQGYYSLTALKRYGVYYLHSTMSESQEAYYAAHGIKVLRFG